jgi:uncharacterized protein with PIN domain
MAHENPAWGEERIAISLSQRRGFPWHLSARRAFRKYGKGRHPAGLNFGDCFSYALSKALQEPLLFKRNDFSQTDVDCHPNSSSE